MLCELDHALDQIESDQNVRALILTGAGERAFSAGTDISEIAGIDEDAAIDVSRRGQAVCERLERFKVPVIAAVSGIAAGGGFELALACHMRLASPDAKFSLPESKIGLIPAYGGTQRLSRVIGSGRALELMISPRTIDSDEAARIGRIPCNHCLIINYIICSKHIGFSAWACNRINNCYVLRITNTSLRISCSDTNCSC